MRSGRGLILLAFAVGTFITLRLTMGPRWHGHGGCHHACHGAWHEGQKNEHADNNAAPWGVKEETPVR